MKSFINSFLYPIPFISVSMFFRKLLFTLLPVFLLAVCHQTRAQELEFTTAPVTSIGDNQRYEYELVVTGADGDMLNLQANTVPSWLSLSFKKKEAITVAGSYVGFLDGQGTLSAFSQPGDLAVGPDGNVYIAEWLYNRIRRVTPEGRVTTFAGNGVGESKDGQGIDASFHAPTGIDFDAAGNLYVVDNGSGQVRKISTTGEVTTLAGSGTHGDQDGTGTDASFNHPQDLAVDHNGNIYIADAGNSKVKKISPEGVVSILAGSGVTGFENGTGIAASFRQLSHIIVDKDGNVYTTGQNNVVRRITPDGVVTTFSGSGQFGNQNGASGIAQFRTPMGMRFDEAGNLYVADFSSNLIRIVNTEGEVSNYAGTGDQSTTDGTNPSFNLPNALDFDADGNLYVMDWGSSRLRRLSREKWLLEGDPTNHIGTHPVSITADDGNSGTAVQSFELIVGDVTAPLLNSGESVIVTENTSGVFYTAEATDSNENTTVTYNFGNSADEALFNISTNQLSFISPPDFETPQDSNGDNIYLVELQVSDGINQRNNQITIQVTNKLNEGSDANGAPVFESAPETEVREVDTYFYEIKTKDPEGDKVVLTAEQLPDWLAFNNGSTYSVLNLAGSGTESFQDGTGQEASFRQPKDVAIDSEGNLFVVDETNQIVRKITPIGVVTTFAGSLLQNQHLDGTGSTARFSSPTSITVDGADNLYVADRGNYNNSTQVRSNTAIRKITKTGVVTTIAGGAVAGHQDGPGTQSLFESPIEIELDRFGNLFVLDGPRIRKITPDGMVSTVVGSTYGELNGTGTNAQFKGISDFAIDSEGNLFLVNPISVKKVSPEGVLSDYLGGVWGNVDGTGFEAKFQYITAITIDENDNLFVTDGHKHSIRKITKNRVVSTIYSNEDYQADTPISEATYSTPISLNILRNGDFLATELTRDRIMVVSPQIALTGPATGHIGQSTVVLKATDEKGAETLQSFTIDVLETPVFTSGDESNFEENGTGVAYTIQAAFSVSTTTLTYDLGSSNDESVFSIDKQTGEVSFLQSPDFENPSGRYFNNEYEIEVQAIGAGVTIDKIVTIKVTNVSDEAPVFESSSVTRLFEGEEYNYEPRISDASYDPVTITAPNLPGWLSLNDNSQNAVSTFAGSGEIGNIHAKGIVAAFNNPIDVLVDPRDGTIYVADGGNGEINKIDQDGIVTSFVGGRSSFDSDGTGTETSFFGMGAMTMDKKGNIYVASVQAIRKVTPEGVVTKIAGNGTYQLKDGTGTESAFSGAYDIVIDSKGNLFVTDRGNHAIRKIDPNGVVTTFAGNGGSGSTDGTGLSSFFSTPQGLAIDSDDNLYVGEFGNPFIRKITPEAVVTTIAGNGTRSSVDGTGLSASFSSVNYLEFDREGNLYIADQNALRKMTPSGVVTSIAGHEDSGFNDDAQGLNARFHGNSGMAFDRDGSLLVTDRFNHRLRRIAFGGKKLSGNSTGQIGTHSVTLQASEASGGTTSQTFTIEVLDNGAPVFNSSPIEEVPEGQFYNYEVEVGHPQNIATTITGLELPSWLSLADSDLGHVSSVAGMGNFGTRDGLAKPSGSELTATFQSIDDLATDNEGNIYTTSNSSGLVRKISNSGIVSTIAGNGSGDEIGSGSNARFNFPAEIVLDASGNIYVADVLNFKIKKITPGGEVSIFAGSGVSGPGTGSGTNASFGFIGSMVFDATGNLYVSNIDKFNISKITPEGVATIYAGNGTQAIVNGTLNTASFNAPTGLAFDAQGNLFVIDGYIIRKISTTGEVTTFAGNSAGGTIDGAGTEASFFGPSDMAFDSKGNLYVTDTGFNRVRRISKEGVVTTIAGSTYGYQDGVGTEAKFSSINSVAIDKDDNIYVSDNSRRLRKIDFKNKSLRGTTDGNSGDYDITLKAEDSNGKSATQQFTIKVLDTTPPVFTSAAQESYAENATDPVQTLAATDASDVTFALGTNADEAFFQISSGNVLSFIASPDFETPADSDLNNTYSVEVKATDTANNESTQTLVVTVINVNDNAPVFTSTPINTIEEGQSYIYNIVASDLDGDALTVTYTTGPSWINLVENQGQYSLQAETSGRHGDYQIGLTLTDGANVVTQQWSLNVNCEINFTSQNLAFIEENTEGVAYTVTATGADGIVFDLGTEKDEELFEINGTEISFKRAPDFENPLNAAVSNIYKLDIIARAGSKQATLEAIVVVRDVDDEPVLFSSPRSVNYQENSTSLTAYTPIINDPENYVISLDEDFDYSFFAFNNGIVSFKNAPDYESPQDADQDNVYRIRLEATKGNITGGYVATIVVQDVAEYAAVITSNGGGETANINVVENSSPSFVLEAIMEEGSSAVATPYMIFEKDFTQFTYESSTRTLSFKSPPDFENPQDANGDNVYEVRIEARPDDCADCPEYRLDYQDIFITITDEPENEIKITSNGGAATGAINLPERQTEVTTVTLTGAKPDNALNFVTSGTDKALFNLSSNGELSFINAPDFENPIDGNQDNVYQVSVSVSDGETSDEQLLNINITDVLEFAAIITSNGGGETANINVVENSSPSFVLEAIMEEGSSAVATPYMIFEKDFTQFTYESSTRTLSFKSPPDFENPQDANGDNVYELRIEARPNDCADCPEFRLDYQDIFITVTDELENEIKITSNGGGDTGAINMPERQTEVTTVTLTGAKPDNALNFVKSGTDEALFNLSSNGELSFINAPDFEDPIDGNQDNVYQVSVSVSDGETSDEQLLNISITDVVEFAAIITSNGGGETANIVLLEDQRGVTILEAKMEEGSSTQATPYMIFEKDFSQFTYESSTRTLSFKSPPDFENPQDANGDNVYELRIHARPGDCADCPEFRVDYQDLFITVLDQPEGNESPVFTSPTRVQYVSGSTGPAYLAQASHIGALSFYFGTAEDVELFSIDAGVLRFKNTPDFNNPADFNGDNEYVVELRALAGGDEATQARQTVTIEVVEEINTSPIFESAPVISVNENDDYRYLIEVNSPTNSVITLSLKEQIDWLTLAPATGVTGVLSGDPSGNFGPTDIEIIATDEAGQTTSQRFIIDVKDGTDPVFTSSNTASIVENIGGVLYTAQATDADSPTLTYSLGTGSDEGIFSVNSTTGELTSFTNLDFENPLDANQDNVYELSVKVADENTEKQLDLKLTVTNVNDNSPRFLNFPVNSVDEGQPYIWDMNIEDLDGDDLTVTVTEGPSWVNLTEDNGQFSLQGDTQGRAGKYRFRVEVTDGNSLSGQFWILDVKGKISFTSLSSAFVPENIIGAAYTATATGADNITFSLGSDYDEALFDINGAEISFKSPPDYEDPLDARAANSYQLEVLAQDGEDMTRQLISIVVTNLDDEPVVFTSPQGVVYQENSPSLDVYTAVLVNPTAYTVRLDNSLDGGVFNFQNGVVSFKESPDYENPLDANKGNDYYIKLKASDGQRDYTYLVIINVLDVAEDVAVITSNGAGETANISVLENQLVVTIVEATVPTGPDPNASIGPLSGKDASLFEFDFPTKALKFRNLPDFENPEDENQDNVYEVTITARPSACAVCEEFREDRQHLFVTVIDEVEDRVRIISDGGQESANVSLMERSTLVTIVEVVGVDPAANLELNITGPDEDKFSISASGELTFIEAPDFESPSDVDGDNRFQITITANDGITSDQQVLVVTVTDIEDHSAVITSNGGGDIANISVIENQVAVTTIEATVPTGPSSAVSFYQHSGKDADLFEFDFPSRAFTFKSPPDFENPKDENQDNVYEVTIVARPGACAVCEEYQLDRQDLFITVTDEIENSVQITSNGGLESIDISIQERTEFVTTMVWAGPDPSAQYTLTTSGIDASVFELSSSGELSFVTTRDFEQPTDTDQDNVYEVTAIITDGNTTDEQNIRVTITDIIEDAAVITSNGGGEIANISIWENEVAVTTVLATVPTGPDSNARIFMNGGEDFDLFNFDRFTGSLSFKIPPNYENPQDSNGDNIYEVIVQAIPSACAICEDFRLGQQKITVTVLDRPENAEPPVFTSPSRVQYMSGNNSTVLVPHASHSDPVTLSLGASGDESLFKLEFGELRFINSPSFDSPGDGNEDNEYVIELIAVAGANQEAIARQTVTIEVVKLLDILPVFESTPVISVDENEIYRYLIQVRSPIGSDITLSLKEEIDWLTLSPITDLTGFTGVLSGNPTGKIGPTDIEIIATDDRGQEVSQRFVISVTNGTDPVITSPNTATFAEGSTDVAYTLTATHTNPLTYEVGAYFDGHFFSVNAQTGVVTFIQVPDFENPIDANGDNIYELRINAFDVRGNQASKNITITVTDINDNFPVITSNGGGATANIEVAENTTVITTVTATDADVSTPYFNFVAPSGVDQGLFDLDLTTGLLTWKNGAPDFENPLDSNKDNVYEVIVLAIDGPQATEGTFSASQTILITVLNVDEVPPVFTSGITASFTENGSGTVYTAVATDANPVTYSLGTGNDESLFNIDASTGALTFKASPDFETPADTDNGNDYVIEINANDGTLSAPLTLTVTVTDAFEGNPVFTSPSTISVPEQTQGWFFTATAVGESTISYSFDPNSADRAPFIIGEQGGEVSFVGQRLDFENPVDENGDNVYETVLIATDESGKATTQTFYITITDADEDPPIVTSASTVSVSENSSGVFYTIIATDDSPLTFDLLKNVSPNSLDDEDAFVIDSYTGELSFVASPDFENPQDADGNNVYVVGIAARDGLTATQHQLTITVLDVDEVPPVFTSGITASFAENGSGTVYTAVATDANSVTYNLGTGIDEGLFDIDASTGALTFKVSPDFETPADADNDNDYVVEINANDGTLNTPLTLTVSVTDVDEVPPVFTSGITASFAENGSGTVYTAMATDANPVTYSLGTGNDEGLFNFSTTSGIVTFYTLPDFEQPEDANTDNAYIIEITATDGTNSSKQIVTITVTDVDDTAPVFTSGNAVSFAENGTGSVYTATATDEKNITFALMQNADESTAGDEALFDIDANTGVLTFLTAPDFENPTDKDADNQYVIHIEASDGTNVRAQTLTVTVTDVDEIAPTVTLSTSAGDPVIAASFEVTVTFSETVTGLALSDFEFDNGTGANLAGSGSIYTLDVSPIVDGLVKVNLPTSTVSDGSGNANEGSNLLERTLEAIAEAPTAITLDNAQIAEDQPEGTKLGALTVTDPDLSDSHTVALASGEGDTDNASFEIIGGELFTKAGLDFETKNSLSIRVLATDQAGLSLAKTFTITVTNVEEPAIDLTIPDPENAGATVSDMSFAQTRVNEVSTRTFSIANTGTDGDLTVQSIVLPDGFNIDQNAFVVAAGASTELTVTFAPVEAKVYSGNVTVTSNAGNKSFNIAGEGRANNPPIAIAPSGRVAYTLGDVLTLSGYDPDGDAIAFEIVTAPTQGTLVATGDEGVYTFMPNDLFPEVLYEDEIVFKVVEQDGTLSSEEATYPFNFQITDQSHEIKSLSVAAIDSETKGFTFSFDDQVFNSSYTVNVEYLDRTDVLNPVTRTLTNVGLPKSAFSIADQSASFTFTANKDDHPYLFETGSILITLEVATTNGFSDADAYILSNESSGTSTIITDNGRTDDGEFFVIAFKRTMPENEKVSLNLLAVEFGPYQLNEATIDISKSPVKGTVTSPVEARKAQNLALWTVEYSSDSEIGLLDSLEFSVYHPGRDAAIATFGYIEIVEVPDAPIIAALADRELDEDQSTMIDLSVTDPDSEVILTATSSDPDNVAVSLVNGELLITPVANYNGTVNISVFATESNSAAPLSDFEQFSLTVLPVNDRPMVTVIDDQSVNEDAQLTVDLSATDIDASLPIFDFAIQVEDEANATFSIDGSQLIITPAANFNGVLNFEVTADDGLGTSSSVSLAESFTVTVNPVNDSPEIAANLVSQTVVQGFPEYTLDLSAFFSDPETAASDLIYTVTTVNNVNLEVIGATLTISSTTGNYGVETATVTASDGTLSVSQDINFVTTQASSDVTVAQSLTDLVLNEDFGTQTIDLTGVFSDSQNANAAFSYTISGNDLTNASIVNGVLTMNSQQDVSGVQEVYIVANSNGKSAFTSFKVTIAPVNDAPVLASALSDEQVSEDAAFSKQLSASAFTDADDDALSYSASYSADWLMFEASTGQFSGTPANGDVGTVEVTVTVSDPSGAQSSDTFSIEVTNTNDDPTDLNISASSLNENVATGTLIGSFTSTDPDVGDDTFTYSLVSGNGADDNARFEISGNQLLTDEVLDFEQQATYSIRVKTRDASEGSYEEVLSITVNNLNEGITDIALSNQQLAENGQVGLNIGSLTSTDLDGADSFTYGLVSGEGDTDNALFDITDNALLAKASFNFEEKASYTVRLSSTDAGGLSFEKSFELTVTNVNEVATALSLSQLNVDENESTGTSIGSLEVIDPDAADTHSYALVSGAGDADNSSFTISNDELRLAVSPNYEQQQSYEVRLSLTDAGGLSFEQAFTISINDLNDAPTAIGLDNLSLAENQPEGTVIGQLSTEDEDTGDSHTLSLVAGTGSDDNAQFEIDNGQLVTKSTFDFETKASYTLRLKSTDAAGASVEQSFTIDVINEAEAIIRVSDAPPVPDTGKGDTNTFDIQVFNDGDGDLEVEAIQYPAGFSGDTEGFTVQPGASVTITVTFSPQEAVTYQGDIEITSNVGTASIGVIGIGMLVTSIEPDVDYDRLITVYPNPTSKRFVLDLSDLIFKEADIEIYNAQGKHMLLKPSFAGKQLEVDVSGYENGLYLIQINLGEQLVIKKVMVKK